MKLNKKDICCYHDKWLGDPFFGLMKGSLKILNEWIYSGNFGLFDNMLDIMIYQQNDSRSFYIKYHINSRRSNRTWEFNKIYNIG